MKRRFLEQETNLVWKKLSDGTFHSRSPKHVEEQGEVIRMIIGDRLRELREEKGLSQGDIEKRNGPAAILHITG